MIQYKLLILYKGGMQMSYSTKHNLDVDKLQKQYRYTQLKERTAIDRRETSFAGKALDWNGNFTTGKKQIKDFNESYLSKL